MKSLIWLATSWCLWSNDILFKGAVGEVSVVFDDNKTLS